MCQRGTPAALLAGTARGGQAGGGGEGAAADCWCLVAPVWVALAWKCWQAVVGSARGIGVGLDRSVDRPAAARAAARAAAQGCRAGPRLRVGAEAEGWERGAPPPPGGWVNTSWRWGYLGSGNFLREVATLLVLC